MFEILPVAMTQIDWTSLVNGVNRILGRSPTRQLDATGTPAGTPPSFIAALGEFRHKNTNPLSAMKDNPELLRHMSFTFLVSCDRDTMVQMLVLGHGFSIILAEPGRMKENFIVTATLLDWKHAVIESCNDHAPVESREFFNQIWILFDKLGFRDIFGAYRRKDLRDNTFALDPKR